MKYKTALEHIARMRHGPDGNENMAVTFAQDILGRASQTENRRVRVVREVIYEGSRVEVLRQLEASLPVGRSQHGGKACTITITQGKILDIEGGES